MEEKLDVYTRDGKYLGIKSKTECHSENPGFYHKPAWTWVYNSKGEILVQKRAMCKKRFPGLWDMPCAGHVDAGETLKQGAIREAKEEIGVDVSEEEMNNWYKIQIINRDVVELAKTLYEKGYKLFVLSNMANLTFEFFKNDEFFKMCDGIIISAHEHIKKPDRKVFDILMSRYNLKPHECIFIDDDDTGRSYNTANEMGILGRRVLPNNVQDIEKMLNENNIII